MTFVTSLPLHQGDDGSRPIALQPRYHTDGAIAGVGQARATKTAPGRRGKRRNEGDLRLENAFEAKPVEMRTNSGSVGLKTVINLLCLS